ncbi:Coenzyme F420 hydrogenase/dehydrogenase, beta subunit C-terminal domain [Lachnospiraceae bacterium 54-53]
MNNVCEKDKCTGCMACLEVCMKKAIKIEDTLEAYNAVICEDLCVHCNACLRVCQNLNDNIAFRKTISWYQGWSSDARNRKNSSSGGAAYELSRAIINCGGCVFSCLFSKGKFIFGEAETVDELKRFVGSKYVKSNPERVYHGISKRLKEDRQVLFIGLPCQVAGLKHIVGEKDNLYTIDLICHGTPSPNTLDLFLKQYGCSLDSLMNIQFRVKDQFQVAQKDKTFAPRGVYDPYMMAFLNGLIYTENCYSCKYARRERISDITIGDSWQSNLPLAEQKKGISLLLAQTEKGDALIQKAALQLNSVNLEKAVEANHQLQYPSFEPTGKADFFKCLREGKKFNMLVKKNYPKQYMRQRIKTIFIRLGIIREGI